jgi:hypothetical protein
MASEQAWSDFERIRARLQYLGEAEASNSLKDGINTLESIVNEIIVDPVRTAELSALADTHCHCTSAHMMATYQKLIALRDYLVANGF